ncbi:hypothetical protein FP2506_03484 [Fulvimarina pelagi HTCC2506]|uniref:DUF4864 domain-containing protein n=2 Tax=Fulvimarina pelagi TaxID=217511 RepID=Q0G036_9HYPH|nr:DUF4864 domain-containing protein [Fulvimarina pelagi]EAU40757.1 hypothetical protein FP2506_03484 [Fulvimarina pelagi HTCC2506]BAT31298.1 hypothetical protein [Fulvimarina pelagi]
MMRSTARLVILLSLLCLGFSSTARAGDAADVQAVIASQLEAFRQNDGEAAFVHAAPKIKSMFGTTDRFMEMVRTGYPPVYRSSNVSFGELTSSADGFRQDVFMTDPKGQSWVATYTLERQPDGSMKITGVYLKKSEELAV